MDGEAGEDEETCVRAEDLDTLLARFGVLRRPVLSDDDCGFIAIESGIKTKPAEVEVPLVREEVAGYLERTSQLHGLFASVEAREAFVAGLRGRAWMNALTLHLLATSRERRIVVVQTGKEPLVVVEPAAPRSKLAKFPVSVVVHSGTHYDGVVGSAAAMKKLADAAVPVFLDPSALTALPPLSG